MFRIINKEIQITRGDIAVINVSATNEDGTDYEFKVGDVVRFTVYKKKDCNCVELQKDVTVSEVGTNVELRLEGRDTKIGDLINKPTNYWYEVVLNPETSPQTIIGFDEEGEKILTLYPEGNDE